MLRRSPEKPLARVYAKLQILLLSEVEFAGNASGRFPFLGSITEDHSDYHSRR
jgi:hypothetical protein